MAKSTKTDIVGWCSFVAIILAGIIGILNALAGKLDWDIPGMNYAVMVKDILLLIAVFVAGWRHLQASNYKNKNVWTILFIVFLVLAVVGAIMVL